MDPRLTDKEEGRGRMKERRKGGEGSGGPKADHHIIICSKGVYQLNELDNLTKTVPTQPKW